MTDELAIQGNYADFKLVKTRSVCQLVIEVPIERAEQAIKAFGIPQPGTEIPVAVARIKPVAKQESEKPKRERSRAEWSGIRCCDPVWREWFGFPDEDQYQVAIRLREHFGVQSRRELDSNPENAAAWDKLDAAFIEATRLPERH